MRARRGNKSQEEGRERRGKSLRVRRSKEGCLIKSVSKVSIEFDYRNFLTVRMFRGFLSASIKKNRANNFVSI